MEFFQTVMGRRFFESTMPALVRQLDRLNTNLEAILERLGPAATPNEKQEQK